VVFFRALAKHFPVAAAILRRLRLEPPPGRSGVAFADPTAEQTARQQDASPDLKQFLLG
jgi:hypothetical protein